MTDFLYSIELKDFSTFKIESNDYSQKIILSDDREIIYFFCDSIIDPLMMGKIKFGEISQWIVDNIKGHFYFIAKVNENLLIGNSQFAILPLYYAFNNGVFLISNKTNLIAEKLKSKTLNNRFILENVLFNYQLFNETAYKEIKLLPSNSYIKVENNNFSINPLKPIEDYFLSQPKPWKESVDSISDYFIEKSKIYFPNEEFAASLTGGFDGRTLVALGKFHKNHFSTYSFGSRDSSDFKIAKSLSSALKIDFIPFYLDENYYKKSLELGLEFISNSEGNAGFARAHYLFATKALSDRYKYIITGNFGSEIFRAAHIAGIVISPNLYNIFTSKNVEEAILKIKSSSSYKYLNPQQFDNEWEDLKSDLASLPIFDEKYSHLDLNQKFYKFVFEEILRKYFGPELVNQYNYITNRTPFLDFDFLKEILKTELSGVYSDFFTNNPLKRFKGQVVYGHILKKTNNILFTEYTDKGYRPADLLSFWGKLNITKSFIKKRVQINNKSFDPYGVQTAFIQNLDFWNNLRDDTNLINMDFVKSKMDEKHLSDSLGIVLSQLWYINQLNRK